MMSVITISRQLGSGGGRIAARVAEALGYDLVDRRLIAEVARVAQVPESEVEKYDERGESRIVSFLKELMNLRGDYPPYGAAEADTNDDLVGGLPPIVEGRPGFLDGEAYALFLHLVIADLADDGRVVIVGRGGQAILRDRADTLHVRIIAPVEVRCERLMRQHGVGRVGALEMIRRNDRARARGILNRYKVDWDDPKLYHFVLNTGKVSLDMAADLVVRAAGSG